MLMLYKPWLFGLLNNRESCLQTLIVVTTSSHLNNYFQAVKEKETSKILKHLSVVVSM